MNDRESLELAAKAAGHTITDWCVGRRGADLAELSDTSKWNPIKDDGDALRLAVKLRLSPMMRTFGCDTTDLNGTASAYEKWGGDPYAATRRAIVRAAAEIWRSMQEGGAAMRCAYTKEEVRGAMLEALTRIRALPVHADAIRMAHKHAEDAIAKATGEEK